MHRLSFTRWENTHPVLASLGWATFLALLFGLMHRTQINTPGLSTAAVMAMAAGASLWFTESLSSASTARWRDGARMTEKVYAYILSGWYWAGVMLVFGWPSDPDLVRRHVAIWLGAGALFAGLLAALDRRPPDDTMARNLARSSFPKTERAWFWTRVVMVFHVLFAGSFIVYAFWAQGWIADLPGSLAWQMLFFGGLLPVARPAAGHALVPRACVSVLGVFLLFAGYASL